MLVHGRRAVTWCSASPSNLAVFFHTCRTAGCSLRQPLCASADPVLATCRPRAMTVEWITLRAVADQANGEGHVDPGGD